MWDNIKSANICVIGFPEDKNDNGAEKKKFEELMAYIIQNLVKHINLQIQ